MHLPPNTNALLFPQDNYTSFFPKCFILIRDFTISPGYVFKEGNSSTVHKEIHCKTHFFSINTQ